MNVAVPQLGGLILFSLFSVFPYIFAHVYLWEAKSNNNPYQSWMKGDGLYIYTKCPFGLYELYFEWKRDNTEIYDIRWCCRELFVCIGVMRIIFTPCPNQPKKTDENGNIDKTRGTEDKSSSSGIIPFESRRAI